MYKLRPLLVLIVCISITVCVVILKLYFPELIYFNSGLMLVILLTMFLNKQAYTYAFSAIVFLIILFTVLLTPSDNRMQILPNQALAAFVTVLTTIMVVYVKNLNKSVEIERTNLNALFVHASEGIILTRDSGEIVMANPEALRQFLYTPEELLGKKLIMLIPERLHEPYIKLLKSYDLIPQNRSFKDGADAWGLKKTGEEFPIEISHSHFTRLDEKFVIFFVNDITQRKEAESNLVKQKDMLEKVTHDMRKMNTELENKVLERTLILQEALQELEKSQQELSEALDKEKELNEIKSRFVSMASHEFRTPLSTILSSASLIAKYKLSEDDEKREKHTLRIKSSVKHLNELLEDFLNIGKLEEGRVLTEVNLFDVSEFLQDTVDEMSALLKPGQKIKVEMAGEPMFQTDKRLLKNVLINLLSNAIKFSEADKNIEISGSNVGTQLNLQIKDQGMGIPSEDLPHLFSTFYRAKNVVNIQGTGLGLNIVKRYLDMLNGEISLESKINIGTTFKLRLPAMK